MPDMHTSQPPPGRRYRRLYNRNEAIPAEEASFRMTLRLTEADADRLRAFSIATRRPMQDVYREALKLYLDDRMPPSTTEQK
jgi:hypothetical protein